MTANGGTGTVLGDEAQRPGAADTKIAVIGLAGRFPGASTAAEFWSNLDRGIESVTDLPDEDLRAAGIPQSMIDNPGYVKRAGLLDGIDEFDAGFFDVTAATARTTDPQQRMFLQTAWHALEDAGYAPRDVPATVGVFAATGTSGYLINNVLPYYDVSATFAHGPNMTMVALAFGNEKDYIATRVSHELNLTGPSIAVQSACSSSLLAVHLACSSLLLGECDMAVAGGVSIRVPHRTGYLYEPGSIVSPDGRCRAFDAGANGTIFGSGLGAVVLKPLAAAIADDDPIRAVILGSAVNNDGSRKMSFSAPSVTMQAQVVAEAMAVAGVTSGDVGYIETHGTGTPLGDPIEVRALGMAFADRPDGPPCVLGSVKTNIGHLEAAAGIAGLIKAVLAVQHRRIPATLHFVRPNPELGLDCTPFAVSPSSTDWPTGAARIAGISSLGVGGTNVHVIVGQPPDRPPITPAVGPQAILLSARTPAALDRMRSAVAREFRDGDGRVDVAAAAHTLAVGREPMRHRLVAVGRSATQLAEVLEDPDHPSCSVSEVIEGTATRPVAGENDRVAFLFPGQGAQYPGMLGGLYDGWPAFRREVDELAAAFSDVLHTDLTEVMFGPQDAPLRRTDIAQPALFTVCSALARALGEYGIRPGVLGGHSIGEYVAANLAGVLSTPDAVTLVAERGRLMQSTQPGRMLWVGAPAAELGDSLGALRLGIAAINDPRSTVIAGAPADIEAFEQLMESTGRSTRRLRTGHGFHSPLMDPVLAEFEAAVSRARLSAPALPLTSNTTGRWMTDSEARDPQRWAAQIRGTVRFADDLGELLSEPARVLIEVGPGRTLTSVARRHPSWRATHRGIPLVRHPDDAAEAADDMDRLMVGLGRCWAAGLDVDWSPNRTSTRRIALPGYSFEPDSHWLAQRPLGGPAVSALPAVVASSRTYDEPGDEFESEAERILARLCRDLLGVDTVGRLDNFFDLGGDSVVAVQLAAAAGREGLRLNPRDLFEHQTIAALARGLADPIGNTAGGSAPLRLATATDHSTDRSTAHSPPLTGGQWRVVLDGVQPHDDWRVPFLLRLDPSVGHDHLVVALRAVLAFHEALRLRLVGTGALTEAVFDDLPDSLELPELLCSSTESPGEAMGRWLTTPEPNLETATAPVVRAAHLRHPVDGRHWLALSVNHLSVDNASQDILLGDLTIAIQQAMAGEEILLPPVPTPWSRWAGALCSLVGNAEILAERAHWLSIAPDASGALTHPPTSRPAVADFAVVRTGLSPAQTERLLTVQRDQRRSLQDLLLDSLAGVVIAATGASRLVVEIEGTARDVPMDGIDVRRTIGWLTTVHPVLVEPGTPVEHAPRQGLGHDVLRYLYAPTSEQLRARPGPEILLAFLGTQPDAPASPGLVVPDLDEVRPFALTPSGLGHPVELRAYLVDSRLHLDWWVDVRALPADRAEALAADLLAVIGGLAVGPPLIDLDESSALDLLTELEMARPAG